jgi:predicted RNA-binding protein with PUA-like domain
MQYFLAKTDPETYSVDDLIRDQRTVWDGVTNAAALQAIRAMRFGDVVFVYHSGGESTIVAIAKVASDPRPDPKNEKSVVVDLVFERRVDPPVSLKEIKESGLFSDWALVRQGRLSTMAAPLSFVKWIKKLRPGLKGL